MPMNPIKVFYSYAHEDEVFRRELEKHLSSLRQQGLIQEWHDRMIFAGTDWAYAIDTNLNNASLILLLISPDFMTSDYCLSIEMTRAMELHQAGEAYVIPILIRPVDWEGAPFARLQVLPSDARPITSWGDFDQAFLNVSRGIRKFIEKLQQEYLDRIDALSLDITRLPNESTSYFIALENYLKPSHFVFPTEDDFKRNLIYIPAKQSNQTIRMLHEKRRVLLTGSQASGKTVLAIALAKQLQEGADYRVAYRDVYKAKEGEGLRWYQLLRAHDRKGVLYILDNCHLAPQEVDEFCQQWEEQPPIYAQCLLISRSSAGVEELSQAAYHYLEVCEDATLKTHSEDVYWGMIEKYAAYYHQQNSERYIGLTNDETEMLTKQHAHNLVVWKSRLEAWSEIGGRLSEVRQEAVYKALIKRYFSRWRDSLPKLCALRQYEIRAHNSFVESQLPRSEIRQLQEERLLTAATAQNYGMLYDLAFHPAEAREIFEAHVYYLHGRVNRKVVRNSTIEAFQAYLETSPPNYMEVYERLARQKQKYILEALLNKNALQECVARQFEMGNVADVIHYLSRLEKIASTRARELLMRLIDEIGLRTICANVLEHSFQESSLVLQHLQQIDRNVAMQVVGMLDLQSYIRRVGQQNIQSFFQIVRVVRDLSPMQAQKLLLDVPLKALLLHVTASNLLSILEQLLEFAYPSAYLHQFVELLDADELIEHYERMHRANLSHLYEILHAIQKISPLKAKIILEKISLEFLIQGTFASNLNLVHQLLEMMDVLELPQLYRERFVEKVGVEWFVLRAEKENLQHLYWILYILKRVAPTMANILLETLSPAGLATLCRSKEVSISMIGQFSKVSNKSFLQQFLRQFTLQEMAIIFNRSSLGAIGTFLKPRYFYFQQSYQLFCTNFLEERLHTESLEEIGKFLARIQQIPEVGDELLDAAVNLLGKVNMGERVAHTDLNHYALLLYNSRSMPNAYLFPLLSPLTRPEIIHAALEKSELNGIQLLIHNVASLDNTPEKRYLQCIQRGLRDTDMKDKIATAEVEHITHFLQNVHRYLDQELAQEYCLCILPDEQRQKILMKIETTPPLQYFEMLLEEVRRWLAGT